MLKSFKLSSKTSFKNIFICLITDIAMHCKKSAMKNKVLKENKSRDKNLISTIKIKSRINNTVLIRQIF